MSVISEPLRNPGLDGALIDVVADWLMEEALANTDIVEPVDGCCRRLRGGGVPITRALVSYRNLHPLFEAIWLIWEQGKGVDTFEMPHGTTAHTMFRDSPFFHMVENDIPFIWHKLMGEEALIDFPVLTELHNEEATDYLATHVPFGKASPNREISDGMFLSWATDQKSGFSEADVRMLRHIKPGWR